MRNLLHCLGCLPLVSGLACSMVPTAQPERLRGASTKRWGEGSETLRLLADQLGKKCPITLQNHGDVAWFLNIRIRQLT